MSDELQMYTKYIGGVPVKYLYGPSWKAMELLMDDNGYNTPEEAKAAWEREQEKTMVYCPTCRKRMSYDLSTRTVPVEVKGVKFKYPEQYAECPVCCQELYVPVVNDINCSTRQRYYTGHKMLQK